MGSERVCRKHPGVLHRGCLEEGERSAWRTRETCSRNTKDPVGSAELKTVKTLNESFGKLIHRQTDSYLLAWLGLGSVRLTLAFGMGAFGVFSSGGVSPSDLGKGFLNPFSGGSEAGRCFFCSIANIKGADKNVLEVWYSKI